MTTPIRIYIVEDEPLIVETIRAILEKKNYSICGDSDNAKEALFDIEQLNPDLVLVDIMIEGELDGVDMAEHLQKKTDIPFIFLTSLSDEKTLDRVKLSNPSGFIVKPFNAHTLTTNIGLAIHKYNLIKSTLSTDLPSDSFFIKNRGELVKIKQEDILFLEAYGNYCNLYSTQKKHLVSHSLKMTEKKLPPSIFIKVHRSYIVNFSKIDSLQEGYVFIGKHQIPVSRSCKDDLMKHLKLL